MVRAFCTVAILAGVVAFGTWVASIASQDEATHARWTSPPHEAGGFEVKFCVETRAGTTGKLYYDRATPQGRVEVDTVPMQQTGSNEWCEKFSVETEETFFATKIQVEPATVVKRLYYRFRVFGKDPNRPWGSETDQLRGGDGWYHVDLIRPKPSQ